MDIFNFFTLLGGLALFLYGMNVMGDSLAKASGGRLEKILETLTSSTLKGVLLGLAVTAVIQSSSATTVMVVGFVNSGIMTLERTVGIIMGANIGTTVTSWILSLSGIEGDSFLIQLLKPSSFSPILAIIGVILCMSKKEGRRKDVGEIMIGFAVLMFGMDTMSGAVEPLADVPEFTSLLTMFRNPVLGVLAGAVLGAATGATLGYVMSADSRETKEIWAMRAGVGMAWHDTPDTLEEVVVSTGPDGVSSRTEVVPMLEKALAQRIRAALMSTPASP